MELGLFFQLPVNNGQRASQRYRETLEQMVLAEDLGFRAAWLAEYHFSEQFSAIPSPLLFLSNLAARTQKLRLGTAMMIPALHHPVRLAEEIGMLDVLSNGRVEVGLGRGSSLSHFQGYGVEIEKRTEGLEHAVDFLQRVWRGGPLNERYLHINPRPIQNPPPISIAANSMKTAEYAIKNELPVLINSVVNAYGSQFFDFVRHLKSEKRDQVIRAVIPVLLTDDASGQQAVKKSLFKYLGVTNSGYSLNEIAPKYGIFGTLGQCLEEIHKLSSSMQIDELICWFNPGGLIPPDQVISSMNSIAKEYLVPSIK